MVNRAASRATAGLYIRERLGKTNGHKNPLI